MWADVEVVSYDEQADTFDLEVKANRVSIRKTIDAAELARIECTTGEPHEFIGQKYEWLLDLNIWPEFA